MRQPVVSHSLLTVEVSRSHCDTPYKRQDSSGRVISQTQRPLPDNTQHSQQTDRHSPGGIRTPQSQQASGRRPHLRPNEHWNGLLTYSFVYVFIYFTYLITLNNLFILAYLLFCMRLTCALFSLLISGIYVLRMCSVNPCSCLLLYLCIYIYIYIYSSPLNWILSQLGVY